MFCTWQCFTVIKKHKYLNCHRSTSYSSFQTELIASRVFQICLVNTRTLTMQDRYSRTLELEVGFYAGEKFSRAVVQPKMEPSFGTAKNGVK